MKPAALALLPFLLLAAPAWSASLEQARAAVEAGDYATAFSAATELADAGDARAMTLLGSLYRKGQGVSQNLDSAIDWLGRAAEAGQSQAQLELALIYLDPGAGRGDYAKGAGWLRRAAEGGLSEAQFTMGLLSAGAFGNPPEMALAASWFEKAAAPPQRRA